MDIDTAANQLYVVLPTDFVRRRDELAAEARRSGDNGTAAAIKQLRKPTLGAWLANLLAHERNEEIDGLLHLREMLRVAQLNPSGSEMRRLAGQRREAVAALVSRARDLAREMGQPVADEAVRELETTLSAVLADDEAAARFRSGRLTSALEYSGFGPLELVPGRALPDDKPDQADKHGNEGPPPGVDGRLRRHRETAENALSDARTAAYEAARVLKERENELARLKRERDEHRADMGALQQQLDKAKVAFQAGEDAVLEAQKAHRAAGGALRKARDRVARAEKELGRPADP